MPHLTLDELAEKLKDTRNTSKIAFSFYARQEDKQVKDVDSEQDFKDQVERIAAHINNAVKQLQDQTERAVKSVTIGKTYASKSRTHGIVNSQKENSVKQDGVSNRWDSYKKKGYHAMVAVACFTRFDIPRPLRNHGVDKEFLTLLYEHAVEKECRQDEYDFHKQISNGDHGGGGRRSKREHAAFVLYAAVQFEDGTV